MVINVKCKLTFIERYMFGYNRVNLCVTFWLDGKKHKFEKYIMDQEEMLVKRTFSWGDENNMVISDMEFFSAVLQMISKPDNIKNYVVKLTNNYIEKNITINKTESAKKDLIRTMRKRGRNYNFTIEI